MPRRNAGLFSFGDKLLNIPAHVDNAFFIMTHSKDEDRLDREVSFSAILNASFPDENDQVVVVKALRILHRAA